eukprot:TRINITY_DN6107_c0_g1_i2.p2 TRINITY_DN6107_c0_g1~~TRINITY_DN6107_c0_g1_i2.p2  ORF type:complete len:108 (-),score=37.72 TRINITY_DN6107_c0_g1_i2:178-501(-)
MMSDPYIINNRIRFQIRMDGWCVIQAATGLVLDIAGGEQGGKLIIFTKHGGDNQLWKLEEGRLVNKTGMVADVMGANKEKEQRWLGGRDMTERTRSGASRTTVSTVS